MTGSRIFTIWQGMKDRCTNTNAPAYRHYGARGIKIDPSWFSFESFFEDMKEGYRSDLTIDRIDPNGDYCRANCRWATMKTQNRNKTNTCFLDLNGEVKSISEWAESSGIPRDVIYKRIHQCGWTTSRALTTPVSLLHSHPRNEQH